MNIKNIRLSKKVSQKEMANFLGISQSALCMCENGQRKWSVELLPKIAKKLDCSIDELLSDETEKK